ncbi:MAG: hypothetical protein Q9195_000545 [Heterodermia aff. obscurata]
MVYGGKPSAGCLNCKRRKIKCDEGRPVCNQCIKSKRTCLGYLGPLDLVLRNQTQITQNKVEGKQKKYTRSNSSTTSARNGPAHVEGYQTQQLARGSISPLLLQELSPSTSEDVAICKFFASFVFIPRHPDTVRGFMECLPSLYTATLDGSLLHQAVASVSLAIAGAAPRNTRDRILAQTKFGEALKSTNRAIKDREESVKDETLLAVLLMGLYERITSIAEASALSGSHDAGALALVKHRGKKRNTGSAIAITLFNAVHAQIVEHALEESVPVGSHLAECTALANCIPQTMASRLNAISTALAFLRSNARSVLGEHPLRDRIPSLLCDAFAANQQLIDWAQSVPPELHLLSACSLDIAADVPRERFVYCGRIDVYYDLFVATIWNFYRAIRIKVLGIALDCFDAMSIPSHGPLANQRQTVIEDLQCLVDDICGSIPFHLGTKISPGYLDSPSVEFPYITTKASSVHRRAAAASGGWFLIEPYSEPLNTAIEATYTRDDQREWLLTQLSRVADLYNFAPMLVVIRKKVRQSSSAVYPKTLLEKGGCDEDATRDKFHGV